MNKADKDRYKKAALARGAGMVSFTALEVQHRVAFCMKVVFLFAVGTFLNGTAISHQCQKT
jgi:hypothetical protein